MDARSIAERYYAAFTNKTDFSEVPFAEALEFNAPTQRIDGAEPFRAVVTQLARNVRGLEIRHQLAEQGTVVTVYDFDMGLESGPVPMAEVLAIRDGAIGRIDLVFDSKRLAP